MFAAPVAPALDREGTPTHAEDTWRFHPYIRAGRRWWPLTTEEICVRPVDTYDWVRVVSSIDFDASKKPGRIAGRTIKGVAFRLSYWANADGTKVMAGPARIAVICEVNYTTAKAVLGVLRETGLISVVRRGRGPVSSGDVRVGDEYRLTLPLDLENRLRVRTEDEIQAAIEVEKEKQRRKPTGVMAARNSEGLRGTAAPVTTPAAPEVTGAMVPEEPGLQVQWVRSYGCNGSAIPTQHLPKENHLPPPPQGRIKDDSPVNVDLQPEEGEDESDQNSENQTPLIGAEVDQLVHPYTDRIRPDQRRKLEARLTEALQAGWPPTELSRILDDDHAGLGNLGAGLIGRVTNLGPAPKPRTSADADQQPRTSRRPPWCQQCDEHTRLVHHESSYGEGMKAVRCPRCHPLTQASRPGYASDRPAGHFVQSMESMRERKTVGREVSAPSILDSPAGRKAARAFALADQLDAEFGTGDIGEDPFKLL